MLENNDVYWELTAYFKEPNLLFINRGMEGDTTTPYFNLI